MLTYLTSVLPQTTTDSSSLWAVFVTLIAMVVVLVLAYYTTKWLGKRMSVNSSTNIIRVIDRVGVGQDKLLAVVKVGKKTMLIGMAGNSVTKLCDIDDDSILEEKLINNKSNNLFQTVLKTALNKETREDQKESKIKE